MYDAVAIVLFTSLEKHIDEASPALLTLDVLGLFVLGFFGSFVFGVIPGAWSPGVTTKQSISVCSRITRSAPCVSPHISRLPSHSAGVLSGIVSFFFLQFMLEKAFRTLAHFVGNLFFGGSMWSALCPCGAPSWFFLDGRCPCCAVATGCSLLVIVHSCGYWTSLLGPCGGDYTGAVLGLGDCVFCRCRGLFYALHLEVPQVQLIFKDVDLPVVAQWLFPWSRPFGCSLCFSQLPYTWWLFRLCSCFKCHKCSSQYRRRCPHAATSSSSSLCRMGPRPVHRPLCWERLRGILLRPVRGYASFGDELVMSWAIQTFLCGGSRLPFGSGAISLSGLQVGEKAIQMFLCGGSLPFGSGAIPFRVCKLARRRSKRFCAEDRDFLSEAVQFPFGFANWRKGDPNVSVRRIEASFRKRCNSLSGL